MKKRNKKLNLNRETLRHLNREQMERAAGGTGFTHCTSCNCTDSCAAPPTDPDFTRCGGHSDCMCPFTDF